MEPHWSKIALDVFVSDLNFTDLMFYWCYFEAYKQSWLAELEHRIRINSRIQFCSVITHSSTGTKTSWATHVNSSRMKEYTIHIYSTYHLGWLHSQWCDRKNVVIILCDRGMSTCVLVLYPCVNLQVQKLKPHSLIIECCRLLECCGHMGLEPVYVPTAWF